MHHRLQNSLTLRCKLQVYLCTYKKGLLIFQVFTMVTQFALYEAVIEYLDNMYINSVLHRLK
jgi:hypothetical protein